jgi:hypothetical protein
MYIGKIKILLTKTTVCGNTTMVDTNVFSMACILPKSQTRGVNPVQTTLTNSPIRLQSAGFTIFVGDLPLVTSLTKT